MHSYTIITGATSGIGLAIAKALASHEVPLILACRNLQKAQKIKDSLGGRNIAIEELQLSSLQSIVAFSRRVRENYSVSAILNNAGASYQKYALTSDGYEESLATNCIGPALVCLSLIDSLAPASCILNTVSLTYRFGQICTDFPHIGSKAYLRLKNYSNAKLALYLFTYKLFEAHGHEHLINAIDPGIVNTGMLSMQRWFDPLADQLFRPFTRSPECAAQISINALSSLESGYIFKGNSQTQFPSSISKHPDAERVWRALQEIYQSQEW